MSFQSKYAIGWRERGELRVVDFPLFANVISNLSNIEIILEKYAKIYEKKKKKLQLKLGHSEGLFEEGGIGGNGSYRKICCLSRIRDTMVFWGAFSSRSASTIALAS